MCMTELKQACYCVYAIGETFRFRIKTELLSDGTACPAALLRLGVPAQRLTFRSKFVILMFFEDLPKDSLMA